MASAATRAVYALPGLGERVELGLGLGLGFGFGLGLGVGSGLRLGLGLGLGVGLGVGLLSKRLSKGLMRTESNWV